MIRVAVIGLGRIGSSYDASRGSDPRSHAGAIRATPGLVLTAAVDPSPAAREAAVRQWGWDGSVRVVAAIEELAPGCADVVALCTPVEDRLKAVRAALALEPRILLVEKPLAGSFAEAAAIVDAVTAAGVVARVAFQRRFDAGCVAVRDQLPDEVPAAVVMRYGKGLRNYGSHLVDLLIDWYGQVASVEAFGLVGDGPDPALSFRCRMQARFDAVLLALSGLEYDQFEIDVFYRDRRLELRNGGCEKLIHRPVQGLYYPGYSQLGAPSDIVPPAPVTGLAILYSAVRDHLEQGAPLEGCLPEQALHGQVVLETALRSASKGRELPIPAEFTTSWAQA